ncbi:MAG TPA: Fic family protein [Myxococcaceae bacterium]|nr:Fic family protein [Myxococcaceae bacterium]
MHRYHWAAELTPRLEQAAKRVQRLRQARLHPAAVQSLKHWFRIHHTYHSNAIEGNRLTLPETRAVIEDGITIAGKPMKDHLEAVNLAQALDFIESLAKGDTPLEEREVRDIHAIVLRTIEPAEAGTYRRINVRISGSDHAPPEALHVPERMREFGAWLSGEKAEHPVVVAAMAHTWFETIHPFIDGNGRTGRLLANLLLMRHGYPVTVLRVEERARYYAALDKSHTGDLTPMVELTLDCVEQSLAEYERATHEVEAQEPAIEYLAERLSRPSAQAPLDWSMWRLGLEAFHGALVDVAQRITARVPAGQAPIRLEVSALIPMKLKDWEEAQHTSLQLFELQAESAISDVTLRFRTMWPNKTVPEWPLPVPAIRLDISDEEYSAPAHFMEAVPEGPLFAALYGGHSTRHYLDFERTPSPASQFLSSIPPPELRVERGVSAQKLAMDIWTYVIERYLSRPE